jgi:hypothetical protein
MFNARLLKEKMNAQPFKPFRIHMSDGKVYDVPNHDAAFVKASTIEIGLDLNKDGLARRSIDCSILLITSIEELQAA